MVRPAIFLLTLNAFSLPIIVRAQYNHFEKISEEQGLSDNRVTCFKKDRAGFVWIGTENGLNRYDGFRFRIYRPGQTRFDLSHENINDIEEDRDGYLWIATWNGLNLLDPKTDSLTVFSPDHHHSGETKNHLNSSLIWDTYIDRSGLVWIAADNRDLCYYQPATKEFFYYPWKAFVDEVVPHRRGAYVSIQKIIKKSDHEIWLGTTVGLFSFDVASRKFPIFWRRRSGRLRVVAI